LNKRTELDYKTSILKPQFKEFKCRASCHFKTHLSHKKQQILTKASFKHLRPQKIDSYFKTMSKNLNIFPHSLGFFL